MQSIKNTAVTIILLFLSYGVYQVINKPLPSEIQAGDFEPLDISEPIEPGIPDDMMADFRLKDELVDQSDQSIPADLLNDAPNESNDRLTQQPSGSSKASDGDFAFAPDDRYSNQLPQAPANPANQLSPIDTENQLDNARSFASNDDSDFESNFDAIDNFSQPDLSELSNAGSSNRHIDSDSQIIATSPLVAIKAKSSPPPVAPPPATKTLASSWDDIGELVQQKNYQEALKVLSQFYAEKNYQTDEQQHLLDWLDTLATKVIYSSEHHLRSLPYIIEPGDTIGSLARQWQIPAQLIYNVNVHKIPDPNKLAAGTEIKLIQGPFDAIIDPNERVMTLFLSDLYAGRFSIDFGTPPTPGEYQIVDKSASDQRSQPFWIALSNGGALFASSESPSEANQIALNLREAEEIFSILSATSKIKVVR